MQSGDSVYSISNKLGVQMDDLQASLEQCVGFTGTLQVGQKICLTGWVPACEYVIDSGGCWAGETSPEACFSEWKRIEEALGHPRAPCQTGLPACPDLLFPHALQTASRTVRSTRWVWAGPFASPAPFKAYLQLSQPGLPLLRADPVR